jgi:hypothetical protein
MSVKRIVGGIFLALATYIIGLPIVLGTLGRDSLEGSYFSSALGLGWYFALLGALVTTMLFMILYAGEAMAHDGEKAPSVTELSTIQQAAKGVKPTPSAHEMAKAS